MTLTDVISKRDVFGKKFQGESATFSNNVGVNTQTPTSSLQVVGGIRAKKGTPTDNFSNLGYSFDNDGDTGVFSPDSGSGAGSVVFISNSSEVARATSNGRFGIGTTNPSSKLHVVDNMRVGAAETTTQPSTSIYPDTSGMIIEAYRSNDSSVKLPLKLQRFGGNVGIGANTPLSELHVDGDLTMSSSTTSATAGAIAEYLVVNINGTPRKIALYNV